MSVVEFGCMVEGCLMLLLMFGMLEIDDVLKKKVWIIVC